MVSKETGKFDFCVAFLLWLKIIAFGKWTCLHVSSNAAFLHQPYHAEEFGQS